MAEFPCPECGEERGACEADCAACGWRHREEIEAVGECPICGGFSFEWGKLRASSWEVSYIRKTSGFADWLQTFGETVSCRKCTRCGNLQLFAG